MARAEEAEEEVAEADPEVNMTSMNSAQISH